MLWLAPTTVRQSLPLKDYRAATAARACARSATTRATVWASVTSVNFVAHASHSQKNSIFLNGFGAFPPVLPARSAYRSETASPCGDKEKRPSIAYWSISKPSGLAATSGPNGTTKCPSTALCKDPRGFMAKLLCERFHPGMMEAMRGALLRIGILWIVGRARLQSCHKPQF